MASNLKKLLFTGTFAAVLTSSSVFVGHPVTAQNQEATRPVAAELTLACAGFIAPTPLPEDIQIVGMEREASTDLISQNDIVYLNKGRGANLQVGAEYQVVRNVGPVKDPKERGKTYGTLVYELGLLRIIGVTDTTATAQIKTSCSDIYMGDAVVPYEKRVSPSARLYKPLSVVANPTGRATGKIVAARSARELLGPNDIVYVNVGVDNGVKVGDYLTVYRKLGGGTITHYRDDEIGPHRSNGFPSDQFHTVDNSSLTGSRKNRPKVIEQTPRNTLPRTTVGELIVLRADGGTATCLVTRVATEALVGDSIEQQ
ncbi:MAG: hypothetical protein K1Y36_12915 [Blastocatellia bacterium]|nr:hypothetical protein [Blastocatellia bacterium]